jgi:hypothetical protein
MAKPIKNQKKKHYELKLTKCKTLKPNTTELTI